MLQAPAGAENTFGRQSIGASRARGRRSRRGAGRVHSVRSVAAELREVLATIFMVNDADASILGKRGAAGVVFEL